MNRSLKVLIVDDEPDVLLGCEQALQLEGMATDGAGSAEDARRRLRRDYPGILVSDVRLPGRDGLEFLREVLALDPELPVVLITGHGDVSMAVQAMKDGAYDFIQKPFSPEQLVDVVRRALEKRRLVLENRELRRILESRDPTEAHMIGDSAGMARVRALIRGLADSAADVLIQGETGSGKELVARCIHDAGSGQKGNFVAINCGGLPETLFESEIFGHEAGAYTGAGKRRIGKIEHASGGTLFLDEIESMPIPMQVKFLRVLQERTLERLGSNTPIAVECRVIAATKEDLRALSEQGRFRADLYYRLSVATLTIPPLRDRREDIPLLFQRFLIQSASRHGRPVPAMLPNQINRLMAYDWPGNVRELRNVADRCVLDIAYSAPPFADSVDEGPRPLADMVDGFERALIVNALQLHQRSVTRSAAFLGIPKTTLHDKMRKFGLTGHDRS
jgi:DNA-binding NtrC family response regulator